MTQPETTPDEHWGSVYRTKQADQVSWFQSHLDVSLELLDAQGLNAQSSVIDIGGGASTLVDDLLDRGVARIAVLDIAAAGLDVARRRLGARASRVEWIVGDITQIALPEGAYNFWHDRAVLHFLSEPSAVAAYAAAAARSVCVGGVAIIGGFAPDGPERCSGLLVARRSAHEIAACLMPFFRLESERLERHTTPGGIVQSFTYATLRRN